MKRSPLAVAALAAAALTLAGCGTEEAPGEDPGAGGDESRTYSIGITQIATHPSLDAAREGFKAAIEEAGLTVEWDEQSAQGDMATATSIATTFAAADHDLILAIATPTAQATAQAVTDVPILVTAVTEPEGAGLVDSWDEPGGNLTGTSDLNPVRDQLALITELAPDVATVGIVASSGEVNSEIQVDLAREAAAELGFAIEVAMVTNSSEVQQAAESLDVDAFFMPTDNTVVSAFESLLQVAESKGVPLVSADGESVERGAVATYGVDYELLGRQTAEMALRVLLDGADPATMPIETQSELLLFVNPAAAERMGVELPATLLEAADVVVE